MSAVEAMSSSIDSFVSTELQSIVDKASSVLHRPVAIDDRNLRLLAYTEHGPDEVDEVRLLSVMKRPFPGEVRSWVDRHNVRGATRPTFLPGNPGLGLDTRLCAPIRCHGHLFGFLWLIDRDHSITPEDCEQAAAFADEAAVALYRERLRLDQDRSRERELISDLVGDNPDARHEAATRLAELELFNGSGPVIVLTSPIREMDGGHSAESVHLMTDAAFARTRRRLVPRNGLHLVRPSDALLVVAAEDPAIRSDGPMAFAERLREDLAAAFGHDRRRRYIIGAGAVVESLHETACSYQQAARAATLAHTVTSHGDVVRWDDLGAYKLLIGLPAESLNPDLLVPRLSALIDDRRTQCLVQTLECYLDHAGDIQRTSAALFLHRTSLYHRLRRLEQLADVDLANGEDRLALHLALKAARLQGMTWGDAQA